MAYWQHMERGREDQLQCGEVFSNVSDRNVFNGSGRGDWQQRRLADDNADSTTEKQCRISSSIDLHSIRLLRKRSWSFMVFRTGHT